MFIIVNRIIVVQCNYGPAQNLQSNQNSNEIKHNMASRMKWSMVSNWDEGIPHILVKKTKTKTILYKSVIFRQFLSHSNNTEVWLEH